MRSTRIGSTKSKEKGAYILLLENPREKIIKIGKKTLTFKKGHYIYCGSAMNNLQKRVDRHFSSEKKLRWNIDYLSIKIQPIAAWGIISDDKIECWISKELSEIFEEFDEFGASDCKCKTHLYYSESTPFERIEEFLNEILNGKSLNYLRLR